MKVADKVLVGIDPNMSDLLFCVDSDNSNQRKLRYTQDTRRRETYLSKKQKILEKKKEVTKIDGISVKHLESNLGEFNKKTLNFNKFKVYLSAKNRLHARLAPFYDKNCFRRLKLGSFIRRQVTEAHFLNKFKVKFHVDHKPEDVVVCLGDWEQYKHRKFKEPVKGKGFRTMFRRAGYHVFLVDEYRTSCKCSYCSDADAVCETFRRVKNPKPNTTGQILCHGLVRCRTCSRLWNRDVNAASNIWKIAKEAIGGRQRPEYLARGGNHNH